MLAIGREQVYAFRAGQVGGVQVTLQRGKLQQQYNGFLASGRARAVLHITSVSVGELRNARGYVIFVGNRCQVFGIKGLQRRTGRLTEHRQVLESASSITLANVSAVFAGNYEISALPSCWAPRWLRTPSL